MENITLGQISAGILFLGAFIGGVLLLIKYAKNVLRSALKDDFDGIKKDFENIRANIDNLKKDVHKIGISDCKNFLVSCYVKVEQGQELDEIEKERYGECYDAYINVYHENSYIHARHEKLVKEGKL